MSEKDMTMTSSAAVATDPESLVAQFEPLIRKLGSSYHRKMPPSTMYDREDLFQEGRAKALQMARLYDPARGAKFITLLTVALGNRYKRILGQEWHRFKPGDPVHLEGALPDQGQVDVAMDLEVQEAHLVDRYGRLKEERWSIQYNGQRRSLLERVEVAAVLGLLPARPKLSVLRRPLLRRAPLQRSLPGVEPMNTMDPIAAPPVARQEPVSTR